ncbi:MAG: autoinducer binding domain-containing protein, partial [Steroidobacter sp.]
MSADHFDIAQSFIEHCQAGAPVSSLVVRFQHALETLGFRYFACCSHVDPLKPPPRAVVLHTYPREWERTFSELEFYDIDPVFHHASRTLLPFFWDAEVFRGELSPPQQEIFAEASRLGIAHGYTIPVHSPLAPGSVRASCSVIPDSTSLESSCYHAVQLMAFHIYEAASADADAKDNSVLPPELSRRERQCLELAALGKSDWVAGKIL